MDGRQPLGLFRAVVAALGGAFIYLLIRLFGRRVTQAEALEFDRLTADPVT